MNVPWIKDGAYVKNPDNKKVKEHIGFRYLLTEINLHTLILLELNMFFNKYWAK